MPSRLDHAVTGLVAAAWVVMTASACLFVARYGYNLPRQDEWEFVPALTGHEDPLAWVFARHNEHRFPLARVVYLGLHAATGNNFRAGMWLTVVLLAGSAATLCLAARTLRGRSALIDLATPVLLLNAGHAENLAMGYQIAFTLTVALLTTFLAAAVWSDRLGVRGVAWVCGLTTLGVALGGGIGWAFVPGLTLVTLHRVAAACRQSPHPYRAAAALSALPLAACMYVVGGVIELKLGPARPVNDAATTLDVAFGFWTVALGGAGQVGYPLPGLVVVGCVAEALLSAVVAILFRPAERARAAAVAAVILGAVALSLVIGATRPLGNESRYAAFGGLALCAAIVGRARPQPRGAAFGPGVMLVPAFAAAVAWQDWKVGTGFAEVYAVRNAMLNRDVGRGLPVNALAERHVIFPVAGYDRYFAMLHDSGHPSLRRAGPVRTLRTTALPLPAGVRLPAYDGIGPIPALVLPLPKPTRMDAVRLEINCPDSRYREVWRLELSANADESAGVTTVWLVPGRRTLLFRVEGTLDSIVIRPVERTLGLELLKCEAVEYE